MSKKIKSYIVSSANWEFEIDDIDSESAALSGLVMAMGEFKDKLLISTVVMSNPKVNHEHNNISHADFYSSESIFDKLGFKDISRHLKEFLKQSNELKHTRK